MSHDSPQTVVLQFNEYINSRNHEGLGLLMTDDHTLIDTGSRAIRGKGRVVEAWKSFFELVPDYQNVFDDIVCQDDLVTITGHSTCSDKRLQGPAIWTAKVKGRKIAEWRVYEDTTETRNLLGLS